MILTVMLVFFGFGQGAQIAWWMFVLAAMFDLAMAEELFSSDE